MKNKSKDDLFMSKRPCYYCFQDLTEPSLYWFIPFSSNIEKFRKLRNQKLKQFNRCNTIIIAEINNIENVF